MYLQENVLQHDSFPSDATKEDLQQFLRYSETKIGIFQAEVYVTVKLNI